MDKADEIYVTISGIPYMKHVILIDVNVPYKFAVDRKENKLFFCINADEFSDQSFQSVMLDLNTEIPTIVESIRNGFASAVDHVNGIVYLAGSDGIFKYNQTSKDVEKPGIFCGVDVFDMYYRNNLYFIDTANLDLYVLDKGKRNAVVSMEEAEIQHFTIAGNGDIILASSIGLHYIEQGNTTPVWFSFNVGHVRGLATDIYGVPYIICDNGIYLVQQQNWELEKLLSLQDGYALDFDKYNNFIYSDGRSVIKLIRI